MTLDTETRVVIETMHGKRINLQPLPLCTVCTMYDLSARRVIAGLAYLGQYITPAGSASRPVVIKVA